MVMIVGKRFQISLHLVGRAVLVDYLQFGTGKLAALWFHAAIINTNYFHTPQSALDYVTLLPLPEASGNGRKSYRHPHGAYVSLAH